jgi:hypothetical protein
MRRQIVEDITPAEAALEVVRAGLGQVATPASYNRYEQMERSPVFHAVYNLITRAFGFTCDALELEVDEHNVCRMPSLFNEELDRITIVQWYATLDRNETQVFNAVSMNVSHRLASLRRRIESEESKLAALIQFLNGIEALELVRSSQIRAMKKGFRVKTSFQIEDEDLDVPDEDELEKMPTQDE